MATGETQTNVCSLKREREVESEWESKLDTRCRICVARTLAVAVKKSQPLGTRWGCLQSPDWLGLWLALTLPAPPAPTQCSDKVTDGQTSVRMSITGRYELMELAACLPACLPSSKWAATFWGHTSLEANLKLEKKLKAEKLPQDPRSRRWEVGGGSGSATWGYSRKVVSCWQNATNTAAISTRAAAAPEHAGIVALD